MKKEKEYWQSDERILGDGEFVANILQKEVNKNKIQEKFKKREWDFEKLVIEVCKKKEVKPEAIYRRCRETKEAKIRAIVAYLSRNKLEMKVKEIGESLNITHTAASRLIDKGQNYMDEFEEDFLKH